VRQRDVESEMALDLLRGCLERVVVRWRKRGTDGFVRICQEQEVLLADDAGGGRIEIDGKRTAWRGQLVSELFQDPGQGLRTRFDSHDSPPPINNRFQRGDRKSAEPTARG
jgi:hypothetical protein